MGWDNTDVSDAELLKPSAQHKTSAISFTFCKLSKLTVEYQQGLKTENYFKSFDDTKSQIMISFSWLR
jgi:hypothetical protein